MRRTTDAVASTRVRDALVVALIMCAVPALARAQSAADAGAPGSNEPAAQTPEDRPMRVGCAGSEPFVVARDGALEGLAIDVWRAAAARLGVRYELQRFPSVAAGVDALGAGGIDVLVGPVSITAERAQRVRFTQPYMQSSLSILARAEPPTLWRRIAPFFSRTLFAGVALLLGVLVLVGVLIWLAERRRNPEQFPRSPVRGVANGMWFALVTFTTVGYGDRAPASVTGRVVAGVWMLIAVIGASSLTAGIASTLTVSSLSRGTIETAEQLANRRVAVVRGTPAARFAQRRNARTVEVRDLAGAAQALLARRVDAVVFDRPQLLDFVHRHPDASVTVSQARYVPQGYGFALSLAASDVAHRLNVALLELEETGQVRQLSNEWIGQATDE